LFKGTVIAQLGKGKDVKSPEKGTEDTGYCKIYGVRVSTKMEPVGEGIDIDAIKQEKAFGALFEKMGLRF